MTNTLYHYCSTESFLSIIQNRSIWLSSLKLSNDSAEGRIIADMMLKKAADYEWESADLTEFGNLLKTLVGDIDGLGFCMTEESDLLSQWRGYADDGQGVCIGFSKTFLSSLIGKEAHPNGLFKVVYNKQQQEKLFLHHFIRLSELVTKGALKSTTRPQAILGEPMSEQEKREVEDLSREFYYTVFDIMIYFFLAKGEAFIEEKEWRVLLLVVHTLGNRFRNAPSYRAEKNQIRPYQSLSISPNEGDADGGVITEVILGPKHCTPTRNVKELLINHGFLDVEVRHSSATYR